MAVLKASHVLREGILVGIAGAAAVAVWLLVVDLITGHPFQTPAALGAGLFLGQRGVEAMPANPGWLIIGYTLFHVGAFVLAGIAAETIIHLVQRDPTVLMIGVFAPFAIFEVAYYTVAQLFVVAVLPGVSWTALIVGNLLALAAMAAVMLARHPQIRLSEYPKPQT